MDTTSVLNDLEREIYDSYQIFMEFYHQKRDLASLTELFSDNIINIGSGTDELKTGISEVITIFKRDIDQCPNPLSYKEQFIRVMKTGPDQGMVISVFDSSGEINNHPFTDKGVRVTMFWQKSESKKWKINHIHFSKPEQRLQDGESYPLQEIEGERLTLEKLVNQRTRDLCKLNIELSDANKEISEIKQRFETIFEKASDGIILADWKNHTFFMINQRMCEMLGYKKKEMETMWINDLIPKEHQKDALQKILEECNDERVIAEDIPLLCNNNEVKYFDITSQAIKIRRKSYVVSLYRDITEHKKAILHKQQAEIAQKASEAKNLFLANMSHEIRTPVTGIIGMSEILAKTQLDTKQKEYLRIISESSKILLTLINDILDISKIEAGKLMLKKTSFRIKDLTDNIKTLTQPGLISKNNSLTIHIGDNVPKYLHTDRMRIEQIMINLLNNAIKFTNNGTINIEISRANHGSGNMFKISVTDTGIGISEEDQQKLFRKFQQLDSSLSCSADGSGLGLFICKQLTDLMGGEIGVSSVPGMGSTFWFTFESEVNNENVIPDDENEYFADIPLNLDVLLVDDKKVNLQVISLMLQTANCRIDTANNGLEALDAFRPEKHQIILMDIMMPLMDGITAMKELRKRHKNLPPIIAITANAMAGDKEKYLAEGFDAYITKPVTMKKLTSELLELGVLHDKN